jgi:tetratricopeptide (TPR) repeat protein
LKRIQFLEPLAFSYYNNGDLKESQELYESILSDYSSNIYYGDIYALALYRSGIVDQKQGEIDNAVACYKKFISLWNGADEKLQYLVVDAKKRLSQIQ